MKKIFYSVIVLGTIAATSCKKETTTSVPTPTITAETATLDESVSPVIPHLHINIANKEEVASKDVYLTASLSVEGNKEFPDLASTATKIKGRGNSTWTFPKKSYRLKLDAAASVLGLPSGKSWVLLANWQDYTLMTNAVAMKAAQQLNMPFTNTVVPVDLTINGTYRGSYVLTQQVETGQNRIDVGANGTLLEMDDLYDDAYKFKSAGLQLPVMFKTPSTPTADQFAGTKAEFEQLESLLLKGSYSETDNLIDKQQVANYLLVNALVGNYEINHPKSVFMHKVPGSKFVVGPVWDFDWGFGYDETTQRYFSFSNDPLLISGDDRLGGRFFNALMSDPEIKTLFKQGWKDYKAQQFDALLSYVEQYAARIRESQKKDFEIWKIGPGDMAQIKADMKMYLRNRAIHLDDYISKL